MLSIGRGWGGRLLTFWAFRLGAYSRVGAYELLRLSGWALIGRWAVNQINTVGVSNQLTTIIC